MIPRPLVALLLLFPAIAVAQPSSSVSEIEARLPSLAGRERAEAQARLADLLESDDAKKALAYGAQALAAPPSDLDDARRVRVLTAMSWAHMTLGQYDQAVARGEEALRLAEKGGDPNGRAEALNHLGSIAQRRGDPVRALELFTQSLAAGREGGDESNIAMSLNNLGFVYATDLADYDRGLEHHLQALAIRERLGSEADVALSLNNIGIVYSRLRQDERALEYFERALALRRKLGLAQRMAGTLHNIGDVHLERGEHDAALKAHLEALEIRERVGERWGTAFSRRSVGLVYLAMGRLADARRELEQALVLGDAIGDKGLAVNIRLGLSAVERRSGQPAKAVAWAGKALELAKGTSARELQRRSYEELAAALEAAGRPAEALSAYRSFKGISDEILDEGTTRRVASLDKRYEIEKRERELERELNARERQRDAVAVAFVLLALGGLGVYWRRTSTARLAERLSVTDSLTGLKNRRYVHQTIAADVASSVRRHRAALAGGEPAVDADLVFFLADVDDFKAVNDTHGHAAGDRVLTEVSRRLETACRQSDVVARWGGEEFLIVARFTDRGQAAAQAERLRRTVEETRFTLEDGRTIAITCSIGFAALPFSPQEPETMGWEQVLAIADHASYLAKAQGRNAWVGLALPGPATPEGPLRPDTLDAWIAQGRIAVERRTAI